MAAEENQPRWLERTWDEAHFVGLLALDDSLPVFAGHFPGNPLLPGVLQIDWAITAAAEAFSGLPDTAFSGMSRIKFKSPVRPGARLELSLTHADNVVSFSYRENGDVRTEGRLHYHG